jgi:hypothetical protein
VQFEAAEVVPVGGVGDQDGLVSGGGQAGAQDFPAAGIDVGVDDGFSMPGFRLMSPRESTLPTSRRVTVFLKEGAFWAATDQSGP